MKDSCQDITSECNVSWGAFHASQTERLNFDLPAISVMLPLFQDDSKSVAMIRHSMSVTKMAIQHLNQDQVPVITYDQPLFALAKLIQWQWPETYGEQKLVIILGGLHIEMAAWKAVGNWLENNGWVEALVQGNVFTAGVADSLIKVSHVARTKQAHQITASALALLLDEAYEIYKRKVPQVYESKEEWINRRKRESPQFQYWHIPFQLEVLVLSFVKSLKSANFQLYLECITKLAPWFFSLDHPNYARWMSVHVRDMSALKMTHPQVAAAFEDGHFTVHKSNHAFSAVAIDRAHEQNNAIVKGDGGAVGLFQNEDALTNGW
eukprot:Seg873.8 transcript_id=Seg873.8/GoldUCD/mRNA.D3Y31 product="hypothetical protein" protein_id=Seg873.8/GoldUCD/D3Y31